MRFSLKNGLVALGLLLTGTVGAQAEDRLIPSFNPFATSTSTSTSTSTPIRLVNYQGSETYAGASDDALMASYGDGGGYCRTYTFGAEALILKPFQSDGDFGDFNYDFGYRIWAGVQRSDGLGVRARYFDYFQRSAGNETIVAHVFDAEVFDQLEICNWTIVGGAGLRYFAHANSENNDTFDGIGPVATLEAYRRINSNLSLYGIGRYSVVFDGGPNAAANAEDTTLSTLELQIGLQATRQLQSGATLFGRLGLETQQWDDASDSEESISLIGIALGGGLIY